MKRILPLLGILGLLLGTARATPFTFSYTFGDGTTVTGSLDGTQNGNFVQNISNVSLTFAGTPATGPFFLSQYDPGTGNYLPTPILSFDPLLSNFLFSTSDLVSGDYDYTALFYILGPLDLATAVYPTGASQDSPINTSWTLRATTASVPDTASTAALLAIGLLGVAAMNRKPRSSASIAVHA